MFLFFLTNWRYVIVAVASFSIGFGVGYNVGEFLGKRQGIAEGRDQARLEQLSKTLEVKEKHAKIRNHRPDNAALVKRLRASTY